MSSFLQSVVGPGAEGVWALQKGRTGGDAKGALESRAATLEHGDETLLCAGCGHPITHASEQIEMSGRHAHTCVNPAGFVFRIGCFAKAPGCVGVGGWSASYSWFAGYAWQVACCARCSMHLGWAFEPEPGSTAQGTFHGLCLDRLRPAAPPARPAPQA
jgi:hypothetical protein